MLTGRVPHAVGHWVLKGIAWLGIVIGGYIALCFIAVFVAKADPNGWFLWGLIRKLF